MPGSTSLKHPLNAIEDLHAMLTEHSDWMDLGAADEPAPSDALRRRKV